MSSAAPGSPASAGAPGPLWRHSAFRWPLAVAALLSLAAPLWWGPLAELLLDLELDLAAVLPAASIAGAAWFLLPPIGFACGLLASVSPCVLPLVPLNVAAIGAADAEGWRAVGLSARFVLGAALALAALGLVGDLAGLLLVEQRGPVLLAVGLLLLYLGLAVAELLPLPGAGRSLGAGRRLSPVAAGAAFSLVTTPCASPLLAALLATAGSRGVPGLSAASLVAFALGYTAVVFAAGVFGGALVRRIGGRSFEAPRAVAAALLVAAGAGFAWAGFRWF